MCWSQASPELDLWNVIPNVDRAGKFHSRDVADIDAVTAIALSNFWDMGVLLLYGAPSQHSIVVGQEHGTIPLTEVEQQLPTIAAHRLRCRPVRGGRRDVPGAGAAGKSGRPVRNAS